MLPLGQKYIYLLFNFLVEQVNKQHGKTNRKMKRIGK